MWRIVSPTRCVDSVLSACTSSISDAAARKSFEDTAPFLVEAEHDFREAATNNTLWQLPRTTTVGSRTAKEMAWLYTKKMADAKAPGRDIYDEIRMSAPNGRCPLCGRGVVSTLDHHLPKAYYPSLALTPINLVPACQDCNKNKSSTLPTMAIEETLHPYFDNVEDDLWLHARVLETTPAAILFSVIAPNRWSSTLSMRVRNHFKVYRLGSLYTSLAAEEISSIRIFLAGPQSKRGGHGVAEYLQLIERSHRIARLNTWQAAAYSAMASSDWFCQGGFSLRG